MTTTPVREADAILLIAALIAVACGYVALHLAAVGVARTVRRWTRTTPTDTRRTP